MYGIMAYSAAQMASSIAEACYVQGACSESGAMMLSMAISIAASLGAGAMAGAAGAAGGAATTMGSDAASLAYSVEQSGVNAAATTATTAATSMGSAAASLAFAEAAAQSVVPQTALQIAWQSVSTFAKNAWTQIQSFLSLGGPSTQLATNVASSAGGSTAFGFLDVLGAFGKGLVLGTVKAWVQIKVAEFLDDKLGGDGTLKQALIGILSSVASDLAVGTFAMAVDSLPGINTDYRGTLGMKNGPGEGVFKDNLASMGRMAFRRIFTGTFNYAVRTLAMKIDDTFDSKGLASQMIGMLGSSIGEGLANEILEGTLGQFYEVQKGEDGKYYILNNQGERQGQPLSDKQAEGGIVVRGGKEYFDDAYNVTFGGLVVRSLFRAAVSTALAAVLFGNQDQSEAQGDNGKKRDGDQRAKDLLNNLAMFGITAMTDGLLTAFASTFDSSRTGSVEGTKAQALEAAASTAGPENASDSAKLAQAEKTADIVLPANANDSARLAYDEKLAGGESWRRRRQAPPLDLRMSWTSF